MANKKPPSTNVPTNPLDSVDVSLLTIVRKDELIRDISGKIKAAAKAASVNINVNVTGDLGATGAAPVSSSSSSTTKAKKKIKTTPPPAPAPAAGPAPASSPAKPAKAPKQPSQPKPVPPPESETPEQRKKREDAAKKDLERIDKLKRDKEAKTYEAESLAEDLDEMLSEIADATIEDLEKFEDRLKGIKKTLAKSAFNKNIIDGKEIGEEAHLKESYALIEKSVAAAKKDRHSLIKKIGGFFEKEGIDITSIIAGISSGSPLVMMATKFLLDKRRESKEQKRKRDASKAGAVSKLSAARAKATQNEAADQGIPTGTASDAAKSTAAGMLPPQGTPASALAPEQVTGPVGPDTAPESVTTEDLRTDYNTPESVVRIPEEIVNAPQRVEEPAHEAKVEFHLLTGIKTDTAEILKTVRVQLDENRKYQAERISQEDAAKDAALRNAKDTKTPDDTVAALTTKKDEKKTSLLTKMLEKSGLGKLGTFMRGLGGKIGLGGGATAATGAAGTTTGGAEGVGSLAGGAGSKLLGGVSAGVMSLVSGLVWGVIDGICGFFKADKWGVSKISGFLGGFFGGSADNKVLNTFQNMGKWALIGAGIGSVVPVIGTLAGGLVGAAIGGILGLIGGEKVGKFMDSLGNWCKKAFDTLLGWYTGFYKFIGNTVAKFFGFKDLKQAFHFVQFIIDKASKWIKETAGALFSGIGKWFSDRWQDISAWAENAKKVVGETITAVKDSLVQVFTDIGDGIAKFLGFDSFSDAIQKVKDTVLGVLTGIGDGIAGMLGFNNFKELIGWVGTFVDGITKPIGAFFKGVWEKIKGMTNVLGWLSPSTRKEFEEFDKKLNANEKAGGKVAQPPQQSTPAAPSTSPVPATSANSTSPMGVVKTSGTAPASTSPEPAFTPPGNTPLQQAGLSVRNFSKTKSGDIKFKDLGQLGSLSSNFEAGNKGPAAIGWDSTGGWSYGSYQIAAKPGTLGSYLKYAQKNYPEIYRTLQSAGGEQAGKEGTERFKQAWVSLASNPAFYESQHGYIKSTHYDPTMKSLADVGIDFSNRSKTLQDAVWSFGVQGKSGAAIIKTALRGKNVNQMDDEEILKAIYAERSKTDKWWASSTPQIQASVRQNRGSEGEGKVALAQLAFERGMGRPEQIPGREATLVASAAVPGRGVGNALGPSLQPAEPTSGPRLSKASTENALAKNVPAAQSSAPVVIAPSSTQISNQNSTVLADARTRNSDNTNIRSQNSQYVSV